ncbi:MAG: hypothetical protein ACTHMY_18035 [Solirubrobacteraceae bacterium]
MTTTISSRKAPTPRALQKKTLTLGEAADQWERCQREMDRLKPLLDEAKAVLLAHFERTGRGSYKDRIGWNWKGGQLYLDQEAVREFLGAKFSDFQKRANRSRSLVLLK